MELTLTDLMYSKWSNIRFLKKRWKFQLLTLKKTLFKEDRKAEGTNQIHNHELHFQSFQIYYNWKVYMMSGMEVPTIKL